METGTKVGEAGETRGQSQIQFETPAWQKMDTSARLGNTPSALYHCTIMVSPRACIIRLISNHFLRRAMILIQSPLAS